MPPSTPSVWELTTAWLTFSCPGTSRLDTAESARPVGAWPWAWVATVVKPGTPPPGPPAPAGASSAATGGRTANSANGTAATNRLRLRMISPPAPLAGERAGEVLPGELPAVHLQLG